MRRWRIAKSAGIQIFKNAKSIEELSPSQEQLLEWLEFYDKVRSSDDPPSEDIIRNDRRLDHWVKVKKSEYREYLADLKRGKSKGSRGSHTFHEHYEPR